MALIFGAPVIEPQGNRAAKSARSVVLSFSRARTRLTIWCTVA